MLLGFSPWVDKNMKPFNISQIKRLVSKGRFFKIPVGIPLDFQDFLDQTLNFDPLKRNSAKNLFLHQFLNENTSPFDCILGVSDSIKIKAINNLS
jgi:serine/threonine protein kinase